MNPQEKDRYIRWQGYRISHFSFAINLFLGFGVASLAFAINQKLGSASKIEATLNSIIIWWAFSVSFGSIATISRLLDFRYTAQKIKSKDCINSFMAKACGPASWAMFWLQVIFYVGGAYILIKAVLNA